ncbi:MAG: DUF1552 domain-containing protein [Nannocystaceae bacterium]
MKSRIVTPGRVRATAPRKPFNHRFSRRAFLGAAGGAAALVPFVPLLSREAEGADGPPKRIITLFSANGTLHERWAPSGGENDFTLPEILAPLAPYQDRLVVLDGLEVIRQGLGDGHQMGMGSLWTGSQLLAGDFMGGDGGFAGYAGHASVDQAIAQVIGATTPYRSLEFGAQTGGANVWTRMCYAGPNQPLPPEDNPQAMFDRLFADIGMDPQGIEQLKSERRSVIDLVKGDLESLQSRYGGDDRIKIEAHLDAIRAIETRNEAAVPSCEQPALDLAFDPFANDNFPAVVQRQIDLMVMALACDLTRVASLQCSASVSGVVFTWLGQSVGHHDLSHLGDDDPTMLDQITAVNTWYADQVLRYLLDRLAAIPEGEGTLLDNTLVVWGNELSRGNSHGNHPVPFVLAGGAGGALQGGRYLDAGQAPHNRMLVSLCQLMDVDVDTFGDNDPGSGGLPGLS